MPDASRRVFLFLQGPHGPFFAELAGRLASMGAGVHRVAFNAGDAAEWRSAGPLHRYSADIAGFAAWLGRLVGVNRVTDIVLYGDPRPLHRQALDVAGHFGLRTHCFEEGYVRPSWITYERKGNNGNSPLMSISLPGMARALDDGGRPPADEAAVWGDSRQHLWHSAFYHLRCLLPSRRHGRWRSHRDLPLWLESMKYLRRTLLAPWTWARRRYRERQLLGSGQRYHIVLLQLSFDASMQVHSDYRSTTEFVEEVMDAFAEGAGHGDHLVLKAHPFEDGRERLAALVRDLALDLRIEDKVTFLDGGHRLERLLTRARSAITVNSTAGQQALCRGIPVLARGRAIYGKPGLVSQQPLAEFIRRPMGPQLDAYWMFRRFMMETSQIGGSFYARAGRKLLLDRLPERMLEHLDAYERIRPRLSVRADPPTLARPALMVAN